MLRIQTQLLDVKLKDKPKSTIIHCYSQFSYPWSRDKKNKLRKMRNNQYISNKTQFHILKLGQDQGAHRSNIQKECR